MMILESDIYLEPKNHYHGLRATQLYLTMPPDFLGFPSHCANTRSRFREREKKKEPFSKSDQFYTCKTQIYTKILNPTKTWKTQIKMDSCVAVAIITLWYYSDGHDSCLLYLPNTLENQTSCRSENILYGCIYLTLSPQERCDTRSIFKSRSVGFKFRVFLLLDWLPCQG